MPEQNRVSIKRILLKSIPYFLIILIFAAINFSIYYYFKIYKPKERFPKIVSTVNKEQFIKDKFKEIKYKDKASYFIPNYWTKYNSDLEIWGDTLNGSNSYIISNINTLGILSSDICNKVSTESEANLKQQTIYTNLKLESSELKKLGDFDGCLAKYSTVLGLKSFNVNQFFVFRQNEVFILTIHTPKDIKSEDKNLEKILSSLIIAR